MKSSTNSTSSLIRLARDWSAPRPAFLASLKGILLTSEIAQTNRKKTSSSAHGTSLN